MSKTIVLVAGGTGGHITPAEAVCERLIAKNYSVVIVSDNRGKKFLYGVLKNVDQYILSYTYSSTKLKKILRIFQFFINTIKLIHIYRRIKPDLVLGFGGYTAFCGMLAAVLLNIPIIIHEQNTVLGRINMLFSKFAKKILIAMQLKTIEPKLEHKIILTGNPVRESILTSRNKTDSEYFRILVIGGSQGAQVFSEVIPLAIKLLPKNIQAKIAITQQARENLIQKTVELYKDCEARILKIDSFFTDMGELYKNCDLVVCRSGASTLAELIALSIPSILIPLPSAQDNHQYYNAKYLQTKDAAILVEQDNFTATYLAKILKENIDDKALLLAMSRNLKSLSKDDAAIHISNIIEESINQK